MTLIQKIYVCPHCRKVWQSGTHGPEYYRDFPRYGKPEKPCERCSYQERIRQKMEKK